MYISSMASANLSREALGSWRLLRNLRTGPSRSEPAQAVSDVPESYRYACMSQGTFVS